MCTLCATLSSGLLGGLIVLEGFVGNMLISEPGLAQEEVKEQSTTIEIGKA
jgi:hypothetical protein